MESGRNGTNPDFPEQPSIASLFPANKSDTDASSEYNQIPPNFSHHNSNSIVSIFPPARSETNEIIIPNPTITSTSFSHVIPSSIGPPTIQISIPSLFPPTVSETEIDGSASSKTNEAHPRVFDSIASFFPPVRSPSNGSEIYETTLDHSRASIFPAEAVFNSYVFQQFLRSLSLQNYRHQDANPMVTEAQKRWLRATEIRGILQNYENFPLAAEPVNMPPSGSFFLFNRKELRCFRKDRYNWTKKRDGKTVMEAHEKLKVGGIEVLNCYHAYGEENKNLKRRSYWLLQGELSHVVLVHYRELEAIHN